MSAPARIIALMYHRIHEKDTDPWGICVSPEHFDEQLRVLKNYLPVITAAEAAQQAIRGSISQTCACITFDDGYEDNCTNALPVLKQHHCPATFFIATAFTGRDIPFWWDELEMICLHSKQLPSALELLIHETTYHFSFETVLTEQNREAHSRWKWYEEAPTLRCHSFLNLWNLIRPLPFLLIEEVMNNIRLWSGSNFKTRLPMSAKQLRSVSTENLVTIGLHTHSHPDLASQDIETQTEEIDRCRQRLAIDFGAHISMLAYPYGRFNDATVAVVRKMGIKSCFTTEPLPITATSDATRLGRYQPFNWNAQQFAKELLSWISL